MTVSESAAAASNVDAVGAAESGFAPTEGMVGRLAASAARSRITVALATLLVLAFAVQALGVFRQNVNWDEFLFLSNVYRVANAEAVALLQTPYTHLFAWLIRIGGDEVAQITAARLVYLVLWAGSLGLLYRLGRHLMDPLGTLAGVALFALFSFSITHATSFRIDGLVLPVLLAVALLVLKPTTGRVAAAGALSGLALALTIKAVLWAPALAGVLAVGLWREPERFRPVAAGAVAAIATFAAIMLAHAWWLAGAGGAAPAVAAQPLSSIGFRMLLEDGFLPRFDVLTRAVLENLATWLLMAAGVAVAVAEIYRRPGREPLLLLLLALPLASLAVYANAWPYAYIVLMPTACLLAGRAFSHYLCQGDTVRLTAWGVCMAAAVPMAASAWSLRVDQTEDQRQILSVVHELFDEPVAYIDKGGMISSFPRQPVFLSRWGLKNYREADVPVFSRYVRQAHPPLVIVNTPILDVWDETIIERVDPRFRLLAADAEALRATYAPYWGAIYLAGRQWLGLGGGESVSFDIVIPGDYTLLSRHVATVDGRAYAPGATVSLTAGPHTLQATGPEPDLRLLWGRGTTIPSEDPSPMPVYTGL